MEHIVIRPPEAAGALVALPNLYPPMPAVTRILARFDRPQVEAFIEVAIAMLDTLDGDADLEVDDRGGETLAISDADECPEDDDSVDPDLEEVDAEDSFVLSSQAASYISGPGCLIADPDAAVDDSNCDDVDMDLEAESELHPAYLANQDADPLPIWQSDDRELRRPHLERVRRERCDRAGRYDVLARDYVIRGEMGR